MDGPVEMIPGFCPAATAPVPDAVTPAALTSLVLSGTTAISSGVTVTMPVPPGPVVSGVFVPVPGR